MLLSWILLLKYGIISLLYNPFLSDKQISCVVCSPCGITIDEY